MTARSEIRVGGAAKVLPAVRHTKRRPSPSAVAAAGVVAIAWFVLALRAFSGGHDHATGGYTLAEPASLWAEFLIFAGGWMLMSAAMMLPVAAPFLRRYSRSLVGREGELETTVGHLAFFCVLGYLAAWWAVAAPAFLAAAVLGDLLVALFGSTITLVALAMVIAGIYQFTPVKRRSLNECRAGHGATGGSPQNLATAARDGASYGVTCLACCWALMSVMIAAGTGGLWLMLALTLVMAYERAATARTGGRYVAAAALVGIAVAFLVA